jgi:hypothetical protein
MRDTKSIGAIPMLMGKKLRRFVYPSLFKRFEQNVDIEPEVEFICSQAIEIGSTASICKYTLINCWHGGKFLLFLSNRSIVVFMCKRSGNHSLREASLSWFICVWQVQEISPLAEIR